MRIFCAKVRLLCYNSKKIDRFSMTINCLGVIYFCLCHFSKGLFAYSCHFFKGLFVCMCHFSKGLLCRDTLFYPYNK